MPRNNAIYFPYINVPSSSWFTRILLYWDQVSSIIPSDYVHNPEKFDPHMQNLIAAGLVNQVMPIEHISRISNFGEPFLNYVNYQIEHFPTEVFSDDFFLIHFEKLDFLADELISLELAQESLWPWYRVQGWVAKAFMTYLATTLGFQESINAAPVTHDPMYLDFLHSRNVDIQVPIETEHLKTTAIFLDSILPYPQIDYEIDDLLWFKDKYAGQLSSFRNLIELKCSEIASIEDERKRTHQIELTLNNLKSESDRIQTIMKSRWKEITLGSLCGIVSAGFATWKAINSPSFTNAIGPSLGLMSSIYGLLLVNEKYKDVLNNPLAYSALTNVRFN